MALKEITARTLTLEEIPVSIRDSFSLDKELKLSEWEGKDKWVLVHDGKHIVVHHGPGAITGTGDPSLTMLCGDEKEIAEQIKKLGLTEKPSQDTKE